MSVFDRETVFDTDLDLFVVFNVGELHVLTVPFQGLVQSLQTDCQYAHYNHFVERTGFQEV